MEEQIEKLKAVVENLDNRIDELSTELLETRVELRENCKMMKSLEKRITDVIEVINNRNS